VALDKGQHAALLEEFERQIRRGIESDDPETADFRGSPEKAAALFAREVMESDRAYADDLSSMRFVG